MFTEKEYIVSDDNYEISKKIHYLFKKYENYGRFNFQDKQPMMEYNSNDLFKDRKKDVDKNSNVNNVGLVKDCL